MRRCTRLFHYFILWIVFILKFSEGNENSSFLSLVHAESRRNKFRCFVCIDASSLDECTDERICSNNQKSCKTTMRLQRIGNKKVYKITKQCSQIESCENDRQQNLHLCPKKCVHCCQKKLCQSPSSCPETRVACNKWLPINIFNTANCTKAEKYLPISSAAIKFKGKFTAGRQLFTASSLNLTVEEIEQNNEIWVFDRRNFFACLKISNRSIIKTQNEKNHTDGAHFEIDLNITLILRCRSVVEMKIYDSPLIDSYDGTSSGYQESNESTKAYSNLVYSEDLILQKNEGKLQKQIINLHQMALSEEMKDPNKAQIQDFFNADCKLLNKNDLKGKALEDFNEIFKCHRIRYIKCFITKTLFVEKENDPQVNDKKQEEEEKSGLDNLTIGMISLSAVCVGLLIFLAGIRQWKKKQKEKKLSNY